jgi:hypothetical protein
MSGCSTANIAAAVAPPPGDPPSGTEPKYASVAPQPTSNPARKYAPRRKTAKTPAGMEPERLLGLSPQEVLYRLGPPAHTQNGQLSREWVYATADCRFRVFFYPEVDLRSFKVLKYSGVTGDGDRIDDSRICVRQILAARSANEH